ncbi:MAG TPA: anhydro-N-acetylmuramic acid kinase [Tepidisphaeraceae bacterium]|nr:anhydro-N-acetylmuramic acid kinase [Tepidisphaeraceae bacterium]
MRRDAAPTPGERIGERIIAGAMSGTSADGVDVALVCVGGRGTSMTARLLHHHHRTYGPVLKQLIFSLRAAESATLSDLARCTREVSLAYAEAVNAAIAGAGMTAEELSAVAAHGQTAYHAPPDTIQLLDPSLVAARTGCAVVSDFRRADCAAGGQGAPLVPFADYIFFRHPERNRAVVNIGGIANMTCLYAGGTTGDIRAFDTGPGNCISDHLMRTHDPAGPGIDVGGRLASMGRASGPVFEVLLKHPYFEKVGPKSTDGPEMIRIFVDAVRTHDPRLPLEDQLATAAALTAWLIHLSLYNFGSEFDGEMILSGGGVRNEAVMRHLRRYVRRLLTTDELGVPSEAKEAIAFALLGAATLDGLPSNVPSATGASRAVVLGSITPKPD